MRASNGEGEGRKSLNSLENASLTSLICQLSLALVFGVFVGFSASLQWVLYDAVHQGWGWLIRDDHAPTNQDGGGTDSHAAEQGSGSFYAVWVHWTLGAALSGGICKKKYNLRMFFFQFNSYYLVV
jgi:hypothetical protein